MLSILLHFRQKIDRFSWRKISVECTASEFDQATVEILEQRSIQHNKAIQQKTVNVLSSSPLIGHQGESLKCFGKSNSICWSGGFISFWQKQECHISHLSSYFWTKKDKILHKVPKYGCKVLQLYCLVSKQLQTFFYIT